MILAERKSMPYLSFTKLAIKSSARFVRRRLTSIARARPVAESWGCQASVGMRGARLSDITVLTEFESVSLSVMMIFLERTHVVLGRSHGDFGSAWFLWVAHGMPLGDGVKDDLSRERSRLSKLRVANQLSLNPLPLRLQLAFYFL